VTPAGDVHGLNSAATEQPSAPKPRGFQFVDWKSILVSVIPAEAGIQAVLEVEPKTNLDAGGSLS